MGDLEIDFDDDDVLLEDVELVSDRRTEFRVTLGKIWIRFEKRDHPVWDISKTGMYIRTLIADFPPHDPFKFQLIAELNDTTISVPASGRVVRRDKHRGYAINYRTSVKVWEKLFAESEPVD